MNTINPFSLSQVKNNLLRQAIKVITKFNVLEGWYHDWQVEHDMQKGDTDKFIDYTLKHLGVKKDIINSDKLEDIPKTGTFIIVANHPLGGIEGLQLTQLLRQYRPDLKVLTNEMLSSISELSDIFIGVDVLNQNRAQYNSKSIRAVASHLSNKGALLVFPAGTVSGVTLPDLQLTDAPWNPMIARLASKYDAPVMPIFVEAKNSLTFYLSAYIHKRLRTLLLPRAMTNKVGDTIKLHIGAPISANDIRRLEDDDTAIQFIRLCCKVMGKPTEKEIDQDLDTRVAIQNDVDQTLLTEHLKTLDEYHLCDNKEFSLYCAPITVLGPIMQQLSIVREHTFRGVDEGTGQELDSDTFDHNYMHLFLWDTHHNRIAGGYRLGKTDEIFKQNGLNGLYSHSLFQYDDDFLSSMGKTIEVGRSFVAKDYQKNPAALDTLWKGIGHFVAKNPEYHTLFGCVSISRQYSHMATAILIETFLSHYGVEDSVASKVKARVPPKKYSGPWTADQLEKVSQIPIINKLVGRIDPGKSIPTLIRHYLSLNGRFVSFTVNNGFNDSLDGLILVDLRHTSERYLKRYMSEEGFQKFTQQHKILTSKSPKDIPS